MGAQRFYKMLGSSRFWIIKSRTIRIPNVNSLPSMLRMRFEIKLAISALALLLNTTGNCQVSDFWQTDFRKADSIALVFGGRTLKNPGQLAQDITKGLTTDHEKFRAIFRWITDNISYDYELYLKIIRTEKKRFGRKKQSELASRASKRMYRHLIRKEKTICAGYAKLLEYMCEQVGLECPFVGGYARAFSLESTKAPNHAWNAVKLGNKWYLCDVTWASGFVDTEVKRFFKSFNEIYFLTDPNLLIANHYPTDRRWILLKGPPSLSEFANAPFKSEGFIENWINHYTPEKGILRIKNTDKFELRFTCNTPVVNSKARVTLTKKADRKYHEEVFCDLTSNNVGEYVLNYQFPSKGTFFLYISLNNKLTFVYEVTVT